MSPWLNCRLGWSGRSFPHRSRSRSCRPGLEELETRLAPSAGINVPVTTDGGVQQMPSVAVDPRDSQHLVIVYMDYALLHTGYAGLGVAVSRDAGDTWRYSAMPLPAGFDQGAANPVAHFDNNGHVY